jgi:hypothetical protein
MADEIAYDVFVSHNSPVLLPSATRPDEQNQRPLGF